ncbi:MAG TPA: patatin-like phospholipase family protein, partial [Bryobacteraceae bacterium]|nr:patatin-like phospholipase family protein [Bryobacteraceae bacterium]
IHVLVAFLGFVTAVVLVIASKFIQLWLTDPITTPHPPPYLVFPISYLPHLQSRFDRVYQGTGQGTHRFKTFVNNWSQRPLEFLRRAGDGYLCDCGAPPGSLKLLSGHVFAISLAVLAFAVYLIVGAGKREISEHAATVPALAFVLMFLIVACWAMSALAFFFDRFRFPLLWAVAGLAVLTANAPESDHFFRVAKLPQARPVYLTPAEYLQKRLDTPGKPRSIILVATPGGGIQAAAWTVKVLSELDRQYPGQFRDSVAMISSVSGGSLGSLIYTATFAGLVNPAQAVQNAEASAIDEAAWGWTQPDFWRAVLPWLRRRVVDRGWAVERRWSAVNHLGPWQPSAWEKFTGAKPPKGVVYPKREVLLSDWAAKGVALPALIFNSMIVETGQHVVFSTTQFPTNPDPRGIQNFYNLDSYKNNIDVRAVTAARLSASFPYVAPASRPDIKRAGAGGFHIVDGGYYDNFGIDSLIGWLTEAISGDASGKALKNELPDILVLQIRHFDRSSKQANGTAPGWFFQTYAPITGLLNMWNAAPQSRDKNELELFRRVYDSDRSKLWFATIQFHDDQPQCKNPPLSWKLSKSEQACITHAWPPPASDPGLSCVGKYLSRSGNGSVPSPCQAATD